MAQQSSSNDRGRKRRRNDDNGFAAWGGYMSAKISKLEGQCKQDGGTGTEGIFSGIAIFVNGYTEPSGEELKRIMLSNGGTFHHYYSRRRTTHIIASNLPHTKVRHLDTDRIVKAAWIVESLAAGRLLDYSKYLLYTRQSSVQPSISFSKIEKPAHFFGCASSSTAECGSTSVIKSENVDHFTEDNKASSAGSETCIKNNGKLKQSPSNFASIQISQDTDFLGSESEVVPNSTSCPADFKSCGSGKCIVNTMEEQHAPCAASSDALPAVSTALSTSACIFEPDDSDLFIDNETPIAREYGNDDSKISLNLAAFKAGNNDGSREPANSTSCTNSFNDSESKLLNQITLGEWENHVPRNALHEKSLTRDVDLLKCSESPHKDLSCEDLTNLSLEDHKEQLESFNSIDGVEKSSERIHSKNDPVQLFKTEQNGKKSGVESSKNKSLKSSSMCVAKKGTPTVEYDCPSNTSNPNFLTDFYNKSRLHHISTMGAMFKEYVTKLNQKPPDNSGKLRFKKWLEEHQHLCKETGSELKQTPKRVDRLVMHIDMDCFFVSVGLRHRPDLVGKPVAVTHAKGNRTNKRPGADINAEFQLYKDRQSKKRGSLNVDQNIASKIRELDVSNKAVASATEINFADNDEGYEAWSDIDEQEETNLLQLLEQAEEKNCANTASDNELLEVKLESPSTDSSSKNEKRKIGKRGTSLLDSTSSLAEIASCSYEARQAGVTNGMFLGTALKLCPQLQTIPYDFEGYKEVSFQLYDIVASYTRSIEAVSCDELYADVSDVVQESRGASPELLAACVRQHVTSVTKCGCSAGMGSSKLSARLATKLAKPHGHVHLDHPALLLHLAPLPLRDLPGVGWSVSERLRSAGAETCGQLRSWSLSRLGDVCGLRTAATLLNFCNGIDDRSINSHHVRKSVSAEVNYGIRFEKELDARDFLRQLCEEVSNRLKAIDVIGRCICLKLKIRCKDAPRETAKFMGHGVCDNVTKSVSLVQPTDDPQILLQEALKLLFQVKAAWCDFRGVGLQVSRLEVKKKLSIQPASAITKFLVKKSKEKISPFEQQPSIESSRTDQPHRETKRAGAMEKFLTTKLTDSKSTVNSKVVDIDVLLALPPDLREHVITEYKEQGYIVPSLAEVSLGVEGCHKSTKKVTNSTSEVSLQNSVVSQQKSLADPDPQIPGPSGYKAPQLRSADVFSSRESSPHDFLEAAHCDSSDAMSIEKQSAADDLLEHLDNGLANTSINASQIDSSFLCALPEDLQEELKRDYQRQKRVLNGLTSPQKLLKLSPSKQLDVTPPRGSPRKQRGRRGGGAGFKSPRRRPTHNAGSPLKRGRRRGRPPKWDIRRADSSRQFNKAKAGDVKQVQISSPPDEDQVSSSSVPLGAEPSAPTLNYPVPSLCGESSLQSVRRLIKEWLQSCPVPGEEDCAILSEYFSDLAVARQLEMMDCLIKLLYRKIGQLSAPFSSAWRAVFSSLLEKLQPVMVREYGAPLKVCSFTGED